MAIEIPMPKLGLTMEEALIIEWLVDDDAAVEADQPILLIETDKTETEVGAPGSGRLHQIGEPGDVFPCGAADRAPARRRRDAAGTGADRCTSTGDCAGECRCPVSGRAGTGCRDAPVIPAGGRLFVSPNARRAAAELGVALRTVRGTGPGGRIVSEDVVAAPAGTAHPVPGASGFAVASVAARNARRPARHRPRRPCPSTRWNAASPETVWPRTCASSSDNSRPHPRHPPRARSRRLRRRQRHRRRRFSRSSRSRPRRSGCRGCGARSPSACTPRCRRWRS